MSSEYLFEIEGLKARVPEAEIDPQARAGS